MCPRCSACLEQADTTRLLGSGEACLRILKSRGKFASLAFPLGVFLSGRGLLLTGMLVAEGLSMSVVAQVYGSPMEESCNTGLLVFGIFLPRRVLAGRAVERLFWDWLAQE